MSLAEWCIPAGALRWSEEYEQVSWSDPTVRRTLTLTNDAGTHGGDRMELEWGTARAKAILRDHVEGLHADHDDESVGCRYPLCDEAFWLISFDLGHMAPIEEMLE